MAGVVLSRVSMVYESDTAAVQALDQVDLEVAPGELVAVMGPSGAGKSSLLSIAGSLEVPTCGSVRVQGVDLGELSSRERASFRRRSLGYVFQDFNLLQGLTALENVTLPLELDGMSLKQARRIGMTAMSELGVENRSEHFPNQLSGGERQRIALARAVVADRKVILADEPTGVLDSVNSDVVMRTVRKACRGDVAGLIATHDARTASWADRVVFLRDGRVVDETSPLPGPESLLLSR